MPRRTGLHIFQFPQIVLVDRRTAKFDQLDIFLMELNY
jgi:hypothetical protein